MTPPAKAGSREWTGLVVIALPCLVYAMDLTVLNLALPALSADFQPSSSELLWIVDIYGFLVAGLLITMGTVCDRIGRRRLLLISGTAFGVASLLAALSTSAEMLLATRALLGVAGATLAPSTLSLLRTMFHDPRERTFAIGVWITSFSAGGAIGPLVGGLLLERFWWGSVFLLAVPVMAVLLAVGPRLLPEFRPPEAGRLDLASGTRHARRRGRRWSRAPGHLGRRPAESGPRRLHTRAAAGRHCQRRCGHRRRRPGRDAHPGNTAGCGTRVAGRHRGRSGRRPTVRGGESMPSPITDALARREVDMNEHSAGHTFLLNGAALYYEERGQGAPVVLVHGGLGSSAQWEPVARELADGFRVITPDSRGHGRSTNPSGRLSYPGIAADLAALIVALELHHPVVGGWSDGGQAALELGARHPDAAGALIIGAAHPDFTASGLRDAHRALLAVDDTGTPNLEGLDAQLGELAEEIKSSHPGGSRQWRELVRQTASMWLDYAGLAPHELQAIHAPALVLAGDRDELVPLDLTLSLYRALPDAELAVCPHVDHAGPTPERAPVVASLIRDFAQRYTTT